jgi:hypothetical protein
MSEGSEQEEQAGPQRMKPPAESEQGNEQDGAQPAQTTPWAFYVVIIAFLCVTVVFLVVWLYPTPEIFTQSSQVLAVLSTTFGIIGTLVGTYFGIKATGDARDTVERVHANAEKTRRNTTGGGATKSAADVAVLAHSPKCLGGVF